MSFEKYSKRLYRQLNQVTVMRFQLPLGNQNEWKCLILLGRVFNLKELQNHLRTLQESSEFLSADSVFMIHFGCKY